MLLCLSFFLSISWMIKSCTTAVINVLNAYTVKKAELHVYMYTMYVNMSCI